MHREKNMEAGEKTEEEEEEVPTPGKWSGSALSSEVADIDISSTLGWFLQCELRKVGSSSRTASFLTVEILLADQFLTGWFCLRAVMLYFKSAWKDGKDHSPFLLLFPYIM